MFGGRASVTEQALIDGIVVDLRGRLVVALTLTFGEDRISGYAVVVASARSCRVVRRVAAASSKLR